MAEILYRADDGVEALPEPANGFRGIYFGLKFMLIGAAATGTAIGIGLYLLGKI